MEETPRMNADTRTRHFKGTAYEIGVAKGQALGARLEQNIHTYLQKRPENPSMSNIEKLKTGALTWLTGLPPRFQEEYYGLAEGAHLPLQTIAEWAYLDEFLDLRCSAFICTLDGHAWVGRNNDINVPELWGYLTIQEVAERIPTINFCMEGDVVTPTGINQERLWLHYNFLLAEDKPRVGKPHMPAFVLLTDMLETCETLMDVEESLALNDRDGGMMLFAVDGKTDEYAIYECSCSQVFKRTPAQGWLVGTNHFCNRPLPEGYQNSKLREELLARMTERLVNRQGEISYPEDLIASLADGRIEAHRENWWTVYANVACPAEKQVWYTFGGYPAASQGKWQLIDWPWQD
ncbi:MAG: hypothetical protein FIA98_13205 [Anaerolineae bacterium]|nr:hypothetical protein [Anaerolineae bacterium]